MTKFLKSQRGDTIIEVLICMALVSFTISTSYSIARRSQAEVRQAEEHGQSLQLGQQQLERFKAYLSVNPTVTTNPVPIANPNFLLAADTTHYGFCVLKKDASNFSIKIVRGTGPDSICAVNKDGLFYCEANPAACATLPSGTAGDIIVDNAGYNFRASIIYFYPTTVDEFYAAAGRLAVNDLTSNTIQYDGIVLPYRISQ